MMHRNHWDSMDNVLSRLGAIVFIYIQQIILIDLSYDVMNTILFCSACLIFLNNSSLYYFTLPLCAGKADSSVVPKKKTPRLNAFFK